VMPRSRTRTTQVRLALSGHLNGIVPPPSVRRLPGIASCFVSRFRDETRTSKLSGLPEGFVVDRRVKLE
jgi:hypothetical protein